MYMHMHGKSKCWLILRWNSPVRDTGQVLAVCQTTEQHLLLPDHVVAAALVARQDMPVAAGTVAGAAAGIKPDDTPDCTDIKVALVHRACVHIHQNARLLTCMCVCVYVYTARVHTHACVNA